MRGQFQYVSIRKFDIKNIKRQFFITFKFLLKTLVSYPDAVNARHDGPHGGWDADGRQRELPLVVVRLDGGHEGIIIV